MKLFIKVKPNAVANKIEQVDATHFAVAVTAAPVKGQANAAVIELLAEHLKFPKSLLTIKRGQKSKQKTIEIQNKQTLL
jgi:uncharacterized protein (TIGR00251 family)